jgi:hypothetical protein
MSYHHDPHAGPHSGQGAVPGDPAGRAAGPIVTADDLAWLEGHKPGPGRAGRSARARVLPSRRNGI